MALISKKIKTREVMLNNSDIQQWNRMAGVLKVSLFNFNGILVPVRTSFGLRRRGGKTYNVST